MDDTDPSADYITTFDFDGDWDGANNWKNQPAYPLQAYIYYWTMETDTHWFIGYADFNPRDWTDFTPFETQHKNDNLPMALPAFWLPFSTVTALNPLESADQEVLPYFCFSRNLVAHDSGYIEDKSNHDVTQGLFPQK